MRFTRPMAAALLCQISALTFLGGCSNQPAADAPKAIEQKKERENKIEEFYKQKTSPKK